MTKKAKPEELQSIGLQVDFPLYRKHVMDSDERYKATYTRLDADGWQVAITRDFAINGESLSFNITVSRVFLDGLQEMFTLSDFMLGRGDYASSELEFNVVTQEAGRFWNRSTASK